MISGVFFINGKGETLIYRYFKDNVPRSIVDAFRTRVVAAKKFVAPVVHMDKASFMYVKHGDIFLAAVTRQNANVTLVFQFLYKLVDVLRAYFSGVVNEDSIRNNFVLIYELLDEMLDNGYPQLTAVTLLTSYIKHGTARAAAEEGGETKDPSVITTEITGSVDWRQPDKYFYKKNEVFIDVLESVNLLMSTKGTVLRADVSGRIIVKSFLSGMPECRFGMNDKLVMEKELKSRASARGGTGIAIDDVTFHRCVKLNQFETERTVSFIPPDGEFELMKYRVTQNVNLPFKVTPIINEHGRTRVEYDIIINGSFSSKLFASTVIVKIPTPPNVAKTNVQVGIGKAKYNASQNAILWKIKKFPGGAAYKLKGEVTMLAAVKEKPWSRPPVVMDFQVPMFTSSGLHVRFLRVFEKRGYHTVKWVRYMTRAGQYQIRI